MKLEVEGITKKFYKNTVLSNVSLGFSGGEIHAIIGENGAGKSTLIKIIGGNYHADAGKIMINGETTVITHPHKAAELGIHIVYQEYNLVQHMTVLDNVLLGKEPVNSAGIVQTKHARERILAIAQAHNIKVNLNAYAGDLSSAEQKITEILRACSSDMSVLILDEPTAALDDDDVNALFDLLRTIRDQGVVILYVSHRMEEIFRLCDRVSILKDGILVGTWDTQLITYDHLITSMVGREIREIFPPRSNNHISIPAGKQPLHDVLTVEKISDGSTFFDVSFSLKKGEILGVGGMSGHGQREMIRSLFGFHHLTEGTIYVDGSPTVIRHPDQAIRKGMVFLSDDRRNEGLAQTQPIFRNISYPSLKRLSVAGVVRKKQELATVLEMVEKMKIRLSSIYQTVQGLSGGNQQRVVLAKWLPLKPNILLFHEPTLGIDIGAKAELYKLLRELTETGISILMLTSDMLELLHMTDRIIVIYEGRIQVILPSTEATEELVMAAASGKSTG